MSLVVNELVEEVVGSYRQLNAIDDYQFIEFKVRLSNYIAKLSSAGNSDPEELTVYGLAYLRELREGPDRRFSGC